MRRKTDRVQLHARVRAAGRGGGRKEVVLTAVGGDEAVALGDVEPAGAEQRARTRGGEGWERGQPGARGARSTSVSRQKDQGCRAALQAALLWCRSKNMKREKRGEYHAQWV